MTDREDYIKGLQQLIEFVRKTPEFPLESCMQTFNIFINDGDDARAEIARYAKMLAPVEKDTLLDDWFILRRKFGPLTIEVNAKRNQVCIPRVVRVEHVPEQVVPEHVIPAHDSEVIEWDCPSLLESR